MRRFIYKSELDTLFEQYKLESEIDVLKEKLFISPYSPNKKQYQIRDDIFGVDELINIVDEHCNNQPFQLAFKKIFEISEDLFLDKDLKKLILSDNDNVAIFIGAGVSKLVGFPLWGDLAANAIEFLREKGKINYGEEKKLKSELNDPKQILSILEKFCPRSDSLGQEFYQRYFKKELTGEKNPYNYIVSPFFNWVKITSNIDYGLADTLFSSKRKLFSIHDDSESKKTSLQETKYDFRKKAIDSTEFLISEIDIDTLYYVHGQLDDLENTIFTTEDYIRSYYNKKSKIWDFLHHIFSEYNVLFVGYGLSEFPILEAVIKGTDKQHFALMESYYHERNVFQIKERYYRQLGIKPLSYFIDYDSYDRLSLVLESWENEIRREKNKSPSAYLDERSFIEQEIT